MNSEDMIATNYNVLLIHKGRDLRLKYFLTDYLEVVLYNYPITSHNIYFNAGTLGTVTDCFSCLLGMFS